ncbi:MAG: YXWGXW repeat-containing protein [Bryobacteraceae bacterium]
MNRNTLRNLIFAAALATTSAGAFARTVVSITVAPPPLHVYTQPPCPGDGYIWTPGYWAYGAAGYAWVPGAWVLAPQPGYLFTPGYWGFADGVYLWHRGHWGLHVGYYGGVNYGFGYPGSGFYGGRWEGGHFFYNRAVSNIDGARFHNTYRDERFEHGHDGAGFHDHREDRRDGHREDRRDRREDHSREHADHGGREHAHLSKVASHSGSGHSGGGHSAGHHGRR